eukprot:m.1380139 g.1380139  ORF g.1380139 m.1380139 type:complete len:194 (+) comp24968_c0_seq40:324-905(+)
MNRPGMNPCVHLSLCVSACVCVAEYLCVVLCVFGCVLLSRSWLQRCDCDCSGPTNLPMPCSHPHAAIDPQVQPKNVTTDLVEELSAAALDNQVTKDEWLRAMLVSLGKVDDDLCDLILAYFDKLDVDGDGILTPAELKENVNTEPISEEEQHRFTNKSMWLTSIREHLVRVDEVCVCAACLTRIQPQCKIVAL